MPMKTTLRRCSFGSRRARPTSTCATISSAPRWRFSPATPLAQKTQPIAQPTCVEMHWVTRTAVRGAARRLALVGVVLLVVVDRGRGVRVDLVARATGDGRSPLPPVTPGMSTVSTVAPSPSAHEELARVVSRAPLVGDLEVARCIASDASSLAQALAADRVMRSASSTPRAWIQRKSWRAVERAPAERRERLRPLLGRARQRRNGTAVAARDRSGRASSRARALRRASPLPSSRRAPRAAGAPLRRPASPQPPCSSRTRLSTCAKRRVNLSIVRRSAPSASTSTWRDEVHEREEHVAHLLLDRARVAPRRWRRSSSPSSSVDLGARAARVLPVEADARDLLADALRARERRHAARHAAEEPALALLLAP